MVCMLISCVALPPECYFSVMVVCERVNVSIRDRCTLLCLASVCELYYYQLFTFAMFTLTLHYSSIVYFMP